MLDILYALRFNPMLLIHYQHKPGYLEIILKVLLNSRNMFGLIEIKATFNLLFQKRYKENFINGKYHCIKLLAYFNACIQTRRNSDFSESYLNQFLNINTIANGYFLCYSLILIWSPVLQILLGVFEIRKSIKIMQRSPLLLSAPVTCSKAC